MSDHKPTDRTRYEDRITIGWLWRNLVPLAAVVLAFIAVTRTQGDVERQREGRRVAVDVLCGGLYGVEDAGSRILTGDLPDIPDALRRPQTARERQAALVYAHSYALVISRAVLDQAGVDGKAVLRKDGSIDCNELKRLVSALNQ